MAIEPAAISARPAVTMMPGLALAIPVRPAASANGTVKPSDIPITMSRTVSPAVKCFSTCGVRGINGPLLRECRQFLTRPSEFLSPRFLVRYCQIGMEYQNRAHRRLRNAIGYAPL